jgi:hypothetical protein
MSLNSQYLVLFKNPRDQQQVSVLARQMYPRRFQYFMDEYQAATERPYGYLFIDLKQTTPEDLRLRTNIFQHIKVHPNYNFHSVPDRDIEHFSAPTGLSENHNKCTESLPLIMNERKPNVPQSIDCLERTNFCIDCGSMYATPWDIQRHYKRGCPEANSDTDEDHSPSKKIKLCEDSETETAEVTVELDESDDQPAFQPFVNEAYNTYEKEFGDKVDQLLQDGETRKNAELKADAFS